MIPVIVPLLRGALLAATLPLAAQVNVLTYQYDNTRAGVNAGESVLTPANVNQNQFGKLFSYPVDGYIYGQPLYLANVNIPGAGVHNLVFVATEHDSVYAFDADSNAGANVTPLWHVTFLNPSGSVTTVPASDVSCDQIVPEIGITGTPVIDPSSGTIYVVAMTKESGSYVHRLHALDVASGAEKPGSPVVIQASVSGTGDGGSTVSLVSKSYKQRPGLVLLNGVVYAGFSSHCDIGDYHGWLIGYDSQTLRQVTVYNNTTDGNQGSFWEGGAAPAVDSTGNIYVVAGNGTFDYASGGPDLGESYIKLSTSSGLAVADYFTPFNFKSLDNADLDVGSAGVALLPDTAGIPGHPHLLIGAGKEGRVYVLDRDNLGKWQAGSDSQIVYSAAQAVTSLFGNPAFFNNTAYFCGAGDHLRAFPWANGALGSPTLTPAVFGGCVPTISANGAASGILWLIESSGTLRAYDPSNVASELYDSNQNSSRDALGSYVKFSVPTVANGKVYAGSQNSLEVYGLLSGAAGSLSIQNAASSQAGIAAPGSIVSIYGASLAPTMASASAYPLPPTLAGVSVSINNVTAPLFYASASLINAQVPFETPNGSAAVIVSSNGVIAGSASLTIQSSAPGIFTLAPGQAAAVNQDGTVNGPNQPAAVGSVIAVYVTGLGAVNNPIASGAAATADPLSRTVNSVTASIGGQPAPVSFAGLAPGFAGLYQVNISVPPLPPGSYPLQISISGVASNTASVSVH